MPTAPGPAAPRPTLRELAAPVLARALRPLQQFFRHEAASGLILLAAAVAAFTWANVDLGSYHAVFGARLLGASVHAAINDGLMTLFFFVVGLEIKHELVDGELRTPAQAALPAVAALGGMVVPALLYLALVPAGPARAGWAIPMATDIAFTIGCLTLLRARVSHALVVFVTALAIFDDIAGILVIALFYGTGVEPVGLCAAAVVVLIMALGRGRVTHPVPYVLGGLLLWLALHHGGLHPTLAGVVLGVLVPARAQDERPLLDRFLDILHPPVAYVIMPLFALANAGVSVGALGPGALVTPVALGAGLGLFVGKQLGIFTATMASVKLGLAPLPGGASLRKLHGVSVVAGIGFTVALFIATLAFGRAPGLLDEAKLGILAGSLLSGLVGLALLRLAPPMREPDGAG